jgi:hypothetical protein
VLDARNDVEKNSGSWGNVSKESLIKLSTAIAVEEARKAYSPGHCEASDRIFQNRITEVEAAQGFLSSVTSQAAAKVYAGVAAARIGIATGADTTDSETLLLTQHNQVKSGRTTVAH